MWRTVKLGDICTLRNGRAYKRPELLSEGKYPVLRVGNFFTSDNWYHSDLELDDTKYCDNGDLLYAWSASFGPRIWEGKKVIYHYHIWRVDVDETVVDKKFLFYWFEHDKELVKAASGTGTTMMHVSKGSMEKRVLSLPPLSEQQRIVAKLDAAFAEIDRAIELAEAKEAEFDRLKASLLDASLRKNAEMWQTVKLGEAFKTGAGGTPLKAKKEFYEDGNIKWLLSGAVSEKDIYSSKTFISQLGLENSSAKIFPENTVLVAMYGATAGQVGILRTEAATNQAVCGIYPNSYYLSEFLFYYLTSYKETLLLEVSGVAQPNLSQEKIKNIPIPIISLAEQQCIVEKLDAALAEIETAYSAVRSQRTNYSILKSAILAQELQPSEAA
jgi:type I restriction enzyme S subunit